MSLFNLPPRSGGANDNTAETSLPMRFDEVLEQQQRWWHEWLEAGQLWTSWWFSQLPPMGWPPVGQVIPPDPQALKAASFTAPEASAAPSGETPAETPPRPSRARSARHH